MSSRLLSVGLAGLLQSGAALGAMPQGGVFIPRNGSYEGCMGRSHVLFDERAGGVMRIVTGEWPELEPIAQFDMVFEIQAEGEKNPLEVRQSFDHGPKILFLEEGNDRIGLRVLFKLYDGNNVYHGHGMTETWLYPDGQIFVTAAATFENTPAHVGVTEARLDVKWLVPMGLDQVGPVDERSSTRAPVKLSEPGRFVSFAPREVGADLPNVSLYWRTGKMDHNTFIGTKEGGAPYYYRWPDYVRQAYAGGRRADELRVTQDAASMRFAVDRRKPDPKASFCTLFRIAVGADAELAEAFVETEREPVELTIPEGGVIHGNLGGYNDQEGSYEVRKTGDPMVVTLPADPLGRTVHIKAVALRGHGAVTATLDGEPVVPQLTTDGGIADDPLAPIREHPEAPADAAMVTVTLTDQPQTLEFREQEGIQLVYQTRDDWRNFAIYSTRTGPRWSGLRFSLIDGHARNMRAYGNPEWALSENLLHWFSFCGYTPEQMLDQLRDFVIVKNGPDEIIYRYTSANANDGAQSEYTVTARADDPAMQINVAAKFTVLKHWPYKSSQFFDVFPFRGVWTQDWWYGNVLWLTADGRWKTMDTVKATYDGDTKLTSIDGGGFFALYSSDRGNMVMLTKNFKPDLPTEYVICGNYIDYHMDLKFVDGDLKPVIPNKGFEASCEYELAVWGDESVTRDQLIEIGKRSIDAGSLVLTGE